MLAGVVVNQTGQPVAGAAIYDLFTGELIHTAADGSFSVHCFTQTAGTTIQDELFVASWLPGIFTTDSQANPVQGAAPADQSVGWTYMNLASDFVESWQNAPVCAQLPSPIRVVLPAAGSIHISGNWPAGTAVALYASGLTPFEVSAVTHDSYYGVDPPATLIGNDADPTSEAAKAWTENTGANGVSFPALSPTGYSVWIGNQLVTNCADIQVTAGQEANVTCNLPGTPSTTLSTAAAN